MSLICFGHIWELFVPSGKLSPELASCVEQGLASFCHGSGWLGLETNGRSVGEFFTGPFHVEPSVWLGPFWKSWEVSSHVDKRQWQRHRQFGGSARRSSGLSFEKRKTLFESSVAGFKTYQKKLRTLIQTNLDLSVIAVWPRRSHLTPFCFSFLIHDMWRVKCTLKSCSKDSIQYL